MMPKIIAESVKANSRITEVNPKGIGNDWPEKLVITSPSSLRIDVKRTPQATVATPSKKAYHPRTDAGQNDRFIRDPSFLNC